MLIFIISPPLWLFVTSFKHPVEIYSETPTLIPHSPTLSNYVSILGGRARIWGVETKLGFSLVTFFKNSVLAALATTFISVIVATCAAFGLARKRMRITMILFMAILIMRGVPRISIAIPLYTFLGQLGLLDTIFALTLTHITIVLPLATFIMYSFFQDLPVELEEAGMVDGATRFGAFLRIIVPLSTPGIAVTAILCFIYSYNEFLYSLIMVSTSKSMTLPVGLGTLVREWGAVWELLSTAGCLAIIPAFVFSLLVQKYIVRGLSLGAIKG